MPDEVSVTIYFVLGTKMRNVCGRRKEEKGASQGTPHCVRSKEHIGDNILKVFYYTNSGNLHFSTAMIISRWL